MTVQPRWERAVGGRYRRVTQEVLGPYQVAVVRIGMAAAWFLLLLREWPNRHELYGPDGSLPHALAARHAEGTGAFTVLVWSDSVLWFELVYHAAMLVSFALLAGWRTRTAALLFLIGVLSVHNRNEYVGDGGDNLVHLIAIYLAATRCGRVWSLDARRTDTVPTADVTGIALWSGAGTALLLATATGQLTIGWAVLLWAVWLGHAAWWWLRIRPSGDLRLVCDTAATVVHNGALLVIMAQVCLLYATAGWYKIQGGRWQDGTAVYYPMQVDLFTPWPALTDLLSGNGVLVLLLTYGTVLVQVAFPFTLVNRRVKNIALAVLIAEHAGIAVLLGLPFFSLAVIAADLVFLPTSVLLFVQRVVRRLGVGEPSPSPSVVRDSIPA